MLLSYYFSMQAHLEVLEVNEGAEAYVFKVLSYVSYTS